MAEKTIPCVYMRGGTSKACFFHKKDLPENEDDCDKTLLRIFGSPDPKQIDGMGGTYPTTSKAAIINCSSRVDADVDYDFRQIGIDKATVGKNMNCGNISAAVGPFAIGEGLVPVVEPITTVRIYNKNTDKLIYAHVPIERGKVKTAGEYEIAGVPGTGARIDLEFLYPQGSSTGVLLPSGEAMSNIKIAGKEYSFSFVDAANPMVFIRLDEFGVSPTILPSMYDTLPGIEEIRRRIEIIRGTCAVMIGLASDLRDAEENSPGLPKVVCCAPAQTYKSSQNKQIYASEIDLVGRFITLQGRMAPAFAVTAGICIGVAASTPGTIVNTMLKNKLEKEQESIRIGHPCGVMDIQIKTDPQRGVQSCTVGRTARRIMDGRVYL